MGSPGWRIKPCSQSWRACSGCPELKAAVARRTMFSALCLFISSTLEQTNGSARKGQSRGLTKRPGAYPGLLLDCFHRPRKRTIQYPRLFDSIADACDYWIPAFRGYDGLL